MTSYSIGLNSFYSPPPPTSDALWIPNQVSSLTEFSDKSSNLKMRDEFFDCKVQHLLDHFLSESETTSVEKLTEVRAGIVQRPQAQPAA